MATHAEEIKAGKRKPTQAVQDAIDDVTATSERNAKGLVDGLANGELRIRAYEAELKAKAESGHKESAALLDRMAEGEVVTPVEMRKTSGLSVEDAHERAQKAHDDWMEGSTYAYRFENLEDGSRIAVYKTSADADVEFEAFPEGAEPPGWHPVKAIEAW